VQFRTGERVRRRGGVFAARDEQQSILLQCAAGGIAASCRKRTGYRKSSLPGREQFGRSDRRAGGCSSHDEHIVVVREEESEMALARRGEGSRRSGEGSCRGIKNFRRGQIRGSSAAVRVSHYGVATGDQNAAVEKSCGRVA